MRAAYVVSLHPLYYTAIRGVKAQRAEIFESSRKFQVRDVIRIKHYSIRTEQAYVAGQAIYPVQPC